MSFYKFCRALANIFFVPLWRVKIVNKEKFPVNEQVIVASNHTANVDPVLIGLASNRPLHYMAKAELFKFKPFAAFITALGAFPVNRGRRDNDAYDKAYELLKNGGDFVIFPQGTRMPGNEDPEQAKSGVAMFAAKSGVPVLPIYHYNKKGRTRIFSKNIVVVGDLIRPEELSAENGTVVEYREKSVLVLKRVFELKKIALEKFKCR